jgi:ESCRT-II complex subunit VPS36
MNQAKEMVNLSNVLIGKISKNPKSSTGEETEDDEDMKKLKSYFLNMGIIDNPVTKETSGSKYYKALAVEIYNNLTKPILDNGGIMTLADVYCRLNRARAIAGLVSAEDLLNACKELNKLNYELKYNVYKDLNLHVLEIVGSGQHNKKKLEEICAHVKQNESLTPYALSNLIQSSLIVAKKLLLDAENLGMLCRDDTYMGLRFYTNLFLQR